MAAQFRAQTLRKALAKLRDEHEARARQQAAHARRAITRAQEQRAHFGVTGQVVRDVEQRHARPDAQVLARMHDRRSRDSCRTAAPGRLPFRCRTRPRHRPSRCLPSRRSSPLRTARRVVFQRAARAFDARGERLAVGLEGGESGAGLAARARQRVDVASGCTQRTTIIAVLPMARCNGTQRTVSLSVHAERRAHRRASASRHRRASAAASPSDAAESHARRPPRPDTARRWRRAARAPCAVSLRRDRRRCDPPATVSTGPASKMSTKRSGSKPSSRWMS